MSKKDFMAGYAASMKRASGYMTVGDMLEHIHWLEHVRVQDRYGQDYAGGSGRPQELFDSGHVFLDHAVRFIQSSDDGMLIVTDDEYVFNPETDM